MAPRQGACPGAIPGDRTTFSNHKPSLCGRDSHARCQFREVIRLPVSHPKLLPWSNTTGIRLLSGTMQVGILPAAPISDEPLCLSSHRSSFVNSYSSVRVRPEAPFQGRDVTASISACDADCTGANPVALTIFDGPKMIGYPP